MSEHTPAYSMDKAASAEKSGICSSADSRAKLRRQQVLEAAEHCFRACGFHGASIASIAKKAGMSSGHIYHYFENKEAIIGASVAHEAGITVARMQGFARSDDVLATLVEEAEGALMRSLDPSSNALIMEILSEAGRNAKAEMLGAMVDGIRIRAIRNPKVNPEALLTQLRSAVRHILEQADGS